MNKYIVLNYDYTKSLLDNVLSNRGIKDIDSFLDLECEDENPLHFTNMRLACGLLYKHIAQNNKILVLLD